MQFTQFSFRTLFFLIYFHNFYHLQLTLNTHWKDCCWSWSSNILATWCKQQTHWKRPWCWEREKTEGENRGWDDWMASLTQWTWAWESSRRWWRTGKPVMLQSMGLQRFRHGWETEQHDEDWITAVSKSPISMSLFLHSLNNLLRIVYVKQLNFPLISIRWWVDQFTLSHFGSENECRENFEVH